MASVAFIGLGVMGYPMAGHLAEKGRARRHRLQPHHGARPSNGSRNSAARWPKTPHAAAAGKDFVFSCVGNDDDLRAVTIGPDGAFKDMKKGAVFIDNTTASARGRARACRQAAAARLRLSRRAGLGRPGRRARTACSPSWSAATEDDFDKAKPVIDAYARMVGLMGPAGAGQLTKMINQICIAGLVQGLAEGIHFGKQAGLDIEKVIDVISKGAAGSWQMENRHKTMNAGKYDFGFAVDWMRKDLGICLDEADRNGARLPVAALVDQFYKDVQAMGGKRWDTSSLLARLEK